MAATHDRCQSCVTSATVDRIRPCRQQHGEREYRDGDAAYTLGHVDLQGDVNPFDSPCTTTHLPVYAIFVFIAIAVVVVTTAAPGTIALLPAAAIRMPTTLPGW